MQFLTNPDGTIPRGVVPPAGARLTRPVAMPAAPEGMMLADLGDGEMIDGVWWQKWTALPLPPPGVPQSVTPVQARLALIEAGMLDAVEALMADHATSAERMVWEYALDIPRTSPMISKWAALLGMSDAQVDELFQRAAGF